MVRVSVDFSVEIATIAIIVLGFRYPLVSKSPSNCKMRPDK